ncbi:MAG: two-component regulator propeller domain-containing protein [Bacteroidota bacterium]
MIKHNISIPPLLLASLVFIALSCNNNSGEIPFPEKELGYSQPVTVPLKFSEEKKLTWDTAKKGDIKPVVMKLDLDALPSKPFDSTGFKPFAKAPEETKFDYNSLPDTAFDVDKLASKPITFTHNMLGKIASLRVAAPSLQKGKPLLIADFGIPQGLPVKFLTCLYKDKQGLLWIGSGEGIFRYDGDHVETIVAKVSSPVVGIAEDKDGRIWYIHSSGIGMIDLHKGVINFSRKIAANVNNIAPIIVDEKGLLWTYNRRDSAMSIIDPETMTYKNIGREEGLSHKAAYGATEDENKNIWISTFNAGINIIDRKAGKIKYLRTAGGIMSDSLSAIVTDKTGKVWVATTDSHSGVEEIDIKNGAIKHYARQQDLSNDAFTTSLSFDNKGQLWKGNFGGLEVINIEKGMRRLILPADGLSGDVVVGAIQDNFNRNWVGTTTGINIIDQNAETVHPFGETVVTSLMEDEQGNIWTATRGGLTVIDQQKKVTRFMNTSNGLSNNFVQSFLKSDHKMYVTTSGGVNVFDLANKTVERLGKKEGLVNDTCYAIFKDKEGGTWLTGPSNGIDRIDSAKTFILHTDAKGGLSADDIGDMKEDRDGLLWLATNSGGIDIINIKNGTVKYLNSHAGLMNASNKSLLYDKYGRIWIGTFSGIFVADTKRGTLTMITAKNGLASDQVLSLLEYNGSVIAGTNIGSTLITSPSPTDSDTLANQWKIAPLSKSQGLIRNQTGAWNTDAITAKGQYLWGDNGITWINDIVPAYDTVATYITGLTVMTQPQHFKNNYELGEKDTLWTTDTFYIKTRQPSFADYTTKGLLWDTVSGPFNMPENLQLPYDKNYIQFQFTQAHLSRLDTTFYTYVLEGIDKNWSAVTNNTYTQNYLNLPSGRYTFKVSSKGSNGKWSEPASFSFTITPPWYRTWWAYTVIALLAAAVLRIYIVYRSRRLQRENKVLEEKVTLRTKQLQQSLEDLKATQAQLIQSEKMASLGELTAGIAHEIQNPLNFINNFSEVNTELINEMKAEIEKGNTAEVKNIADAIAANEQKINHHGKRADGIVKGMLQHSRSGNRQKEPANINNIADEYFRLAYHGLRAKDKTFNATMKTDFDDRIKEINIIPQDIGRVILNLITNAFYAVTEKKKLLGNGYEPTVTVTTRKNGNMAEVRVKDNGNGIPNKALEKIFQPFFTTKPTGEGTGLGLSLSYDIIKAHHGDLKVETKEGEYAEFIVQLPI